tara:strand:- start:219 stop:539 length:321 start_codon:yes stop_codon:yes gene_type:complete
MFPLEVITQSRISTTRIKDGHRLILQGMGILGLTTLDWILMRQRDPKMIIMIPRIIVKKTLVVQLKKTTLEVHVRMRDIRNLVMSVAKIHIGLRVMLIKAAALTLQ